MIICDFERRELDSLGCCRYRKTICQRFKCAGGFVIIFFKLNVALMINYC